MPASSVVASGKADIDGLLSGGRWLDGTTFSFPDTAADYNGEAHEVFDSFAPITARQQQVMRFIYDGTDPTLSGLGKAMSVADFTNLKLVYAGRDDSEMRTGESGLPRTAHAYYPGGHGAAGDVWFGTAHAGTASDYRDPVLGSYAYLAHMHEALHALGLKHGDEAFGGLTGQPVTAPHNSLEYSIVDNIGFLGKDQSGYAFGAWDAPQTPMLLDVQALQHLYGADYGHNGGDTTYRWDPATGELSIDGLGQGRPGGNKVFMTLWDGGGADTYDLSNYDVGVSVDLAPGAWSAFDTGQLAYLGYQDGPRYAAGNVANAYLHGDNPASLVENAAGGSGDDALRGNAADNALLGNAGDDALHAGAGDDSLLGGEGRDTAHFSGGRADYVVSAAPGGGFTVADTRGADGTDLVRDVERFAFADQTLAAADLLPTVDLSVQDAERAEGTGGAAAFVFTARLSFASNAAQSVEWRVAGGALDPSDASDFAGDRSGTLVFAPGETSKAIVVGVSGDAGAEPDETFVVALSNESSGLLVGRSWALATVLNDDRPPPPPPPPVQVSEAQVAEWLAAAQRMVQHAGWFD